MAERDPKLSRTARKKSSRATKENKTLNLLIGVVVLLILVVGVTFILKENKEDQQADGDGETPDSELGEIAPIEPIVIEEEEEEEKEEDIAMNEPEPEPQPEPKPEPAPAPAPKPAPQPQPASKPEPQPAPAPQPQPAPKPEPKPAPAPAPKPEPESKPAPAPEAPKVEKEIVNPDWKPVGTNQTGEHESKYDGSSDDWNEKKKAIAYATGIAEGDLIYWRIQNGGGPQKAEGIVSTVDKSKKYKVYIQWVDGQGWKPVKVEVLNSL